MIVRANYDYDKVKILHAQPVADSIAYTKELRKDESNGWTRGRTMRRVCSPPILTLMEYDRDHPGFADVVLGRVKSSYEEKQKRMKEFLASDYAKPFMTVEKLKHE